MASNKKYWQSVVEIENASIVDKLSKNEFVEEIPTDEFLGDKETLESSSTSRRDFLKYVGFSTAAATLAACEGPVQKSIPFVVKPDDTIVGVADWYASSVATGQDFAHVLVKTREGRPILIVPNKEAGGTTNARVQASILSLYDDKLRLKEPRKGDENIPWVTAHNAIGMKLRAMREANESVVLLTGTLASPSTEQLISEFIESYPNVKHVTYDAISESGAADAFEEMYGVRAIPNYHLDKAHTIVSFEADFLGDWHGGFEKGYAASRNPNGHMSYHVQFEANMTLTGANADNRVVTKGSDQVFALINLYNEITGSSLPSKSTPVDAQVKDAAKALKKAGAHGVVMSGSNDKNVQLIANAINEALQSAVYDSANPLHIRKGNDAELAQAIADIKSGAVKGLITYDVNPVYNTVNGAELAESMKKLKLSVAISGQDTVSATATEYVLPASHFLESWGDVAMTAGHYGLVQPTIRPLFNTAQFQDILLKWSGNSSSYYDYLKAYWIENILEGQSWNQALHDGFFKKEVASSTSKADVDLSAAASALSKYGKGNGFELNLFSSTGLGDGTYANNPWLQEFPDPITRASWDNYLTVSISDAKTLGFTNPVKDNGAINGNYAKVTVNGAEPLENVPVMIQPGQAPGTVGLALGYGRKENLKDEMQVGLNAYPLYKDGQSLQLGVTIEKTSGPVHEFACIQVQKTIAGRHDILKEVSLKDYNDHSKDPKHTWNKPAMVSYDHKEVEAKTIDLWDAHNREVGHHFNLSIDLNSCTGCGACIIACHAENNVPVVGKREMRVGRDMHWLRIDRYYSSEIETREEALDQGKRYGELFRVLETEAENPSVTFQPMMCQHCNHAPCETVCPVAATTHGRQGQNQMTYNRCVGTRYCANNCPYRVRRFNWFNYADNSEFDFNMNNEYGKMVLNPEVVVRSRGVMEKCSMCIQMTQATILKAKREGRKIEAGEFSTACSNACTTGALVFGDVNNEEEEVTKLVDDKRAFHVLDYIQTKPNVVYQVKVRNTNEA